MGSAPRRDQARSEMQLFHLGLGRLLGRFPVDFASRTCLTSLSWGFWIHGRTNIAVISQFGEVVRDSGLCEFHSCALCCESSHLGSNERGKMPRAPNQWGAPKSPNNVASFTFNTVQLLPKDLRFENGGPNQLFRDPDAIYPLYARVTPWTLRKMPSLALASELLLFRSLPNIRDCM